MRLPPRLTPKLPPRLEGLLQTRVYHGRLPLFPLAFVAVVALGVAVGAVLATGGDGDRGESTVGDVSQNDQTPINAGPVTFEPSGDEVPRLAPIVVTFQDPPGDRDDPAALLVLEPTTAGNYVWLDDHRLLFQPEFPGLVRGERYVARVPARAAGLDQDMQHTFRVEGQLEVATVIPADGDIDVPPEGQILVQFNRAVAPLTLLSEQDTGPILEFDPPLQGDAEWLNTSLYRFIPADLRPSTTYTVRIPAGLTSAADGVLQADFVWSFTTNQPALITADPADNTRFVPPGQVITLTFDQSMDPSAAAQITLRRSGNDVPITTAWNNATTVLTLRPTSPLRGASSYEIHLPTGLPGLEGGATLRERVVRFETVGPPGLEFSSPAQGSTNAERFGLNLRFRTPMVEEDITENLRIERVTSAGSAPVEIDDAFISLFNDDREMFIPISFEPSSDYQVRLGPSLTDRAGQLLDPITVTFTTGALEPQVNFIVPGFSTTYFAGQEPLLFYEAINQPSVDFTLWRLSDSDANGILDRGFTVAGDWRPGYPPLRTWTETIEAGQNALALESTSLSGGGPLEPGHYFLVSSARFTSELAFSVVDTTIVTKLAVDELLAWALDYESGEPLAGVTLTLGNTGQVATTNADGLASFEVPPPDPTSGRERAYYVTLTDDGRFGVGSTRWTNGTEPWILGLPVEFYPRDYVGHLYTDRPIYRPGEDVFYKATIRLDDDATYTVPTEDTGLSLIIRDPQGNVLQREPLVLNDFGTFDGLLTLPPDADTGSYFMSIEGRNRFVTSSFFRIAEFVAPEFEVDVRTGATDYIDGDPIDVEAEATFFFGGPVADAQATWSVLAGATAITVPDYESYSFRDFDFFRRSEFVSPLRAQGEAVTDALGVARFDVPASLEGLEGTQRLQIGVSVTDQNDQVVAGSTSVTVHPAALYAGVRPATFIGREGEDAAIDLVTVDTQGQPLPNREVTVRVYEREWITTKELGPQGRFYRSEPQDTLVDTLQATTGADAEAQVGFVPASSGQYRIVAEVTDAQGRSARSSTFLWVSGATSASWQVRNDDVIELIADKLLYEVGDTAEVLVPAPFEGAIGLITVERGKIIERRLQRFETTSETIRIPIRDIHVPNVFVSVVLYRPPTEDDAVPRYNIGYIELPVSTASRLLTVSIEPDRERTQPGETVTYDVEVRDYLDRPVRAEVSVAIVDEAVLSLAEEVGPDGLHAFWFERGLGVSTAASVSVSVDRVNDTIIASILDGSKGGGGEEPDVRGDFRNTAFWTADLVTDDQGHASFQVTMPDNLTTWRAQARAVSGDTLVGEATSEILSTQPLLLRSALPRFLRVGDEAVLRMLVRNATDAADTVAVTLEVSGIDVGGPLTIEQDVPPGQSVVYEWPATVHQAGTATLTFTARGDSGLADAIRLERQILLDVTPETTATGGVVTGASALEAIYLPDYAIVDTGRLDVAVEASLVDTLTTELPEFAPEPREGIDRVASRVIATIAARRAEGLPDPLALSQADVTRLISTQRPDGGWAWCATCSTDIRITAWVLLALGDARAAGRDIPDTVVSRASSLLLQQVNRPSDVDNPSDPNTKAYLLFAAATVGGTELGGPMRALVEQDRDRLTNWGRAYLLLGLHAAGEPDDSLAMRILLADLTADVIASANGNHWEAPRQRGSFHNGAVRVTGLALRALTAVDPEHPLIEETVRWLVVGRRGERFQTLADRADAIAALADYAVLTGERQGDFDYAVTLDGDTRLEGHFMPIGGDSRATDTIPLTDLTLGGVSLIGFQREQDAPGRLYYGLNLRYVTPAANVEALNRGFAISHELTLLEDPDTPIDEATLGDTVRVTLTIVTDADRNFVRVADFLPAGLEPIDPQLDIVPIELRQQLQQEQQLARLANEPEYYAPWFAWYFNPWDQVNVRDDRVELRAQRLPRGVHQYVYFARATTPGDFFVAPPHVEEDFFPEVFGRGDSSRFTVHPGE